MAGIRSILRWVLKWYTSVFNPPPVAYARCWTWDGRTFWMVDEDGTLYQVDSQTGKVIKAIPLGLGNNITGIAWAGGSLYVVSELLAMFYQIDPNTGRVLRFANTPGAFPRGLCWDGRTLWHTDIKLGMIYQIAVN